MTKLEAVRGQMRFLCQYWSRFFKSGEKNLVSKNMLMLCTVGYVWIGGLFTLEHVHGSGWKLKQVFYVVT